MTFQGDPFRTLGIAPSASLNEIRLGLPARSRSSTTPTPPAIARCRGSSRSRRPTSGSSTPRDGCDRRRAARVPSSGRPGSRGARIDAGEGVARGVARAPRRGVHGGRRPETGRGAGRAREPWGARAPGRAATARPAARGRGAAAGAPHAPRLPEGDPGLDDLRRGRRRAARPGVGGGSWYGPSSRTYWTINPREYADPRKHGPEYQARARRAARAEADGTSETAASAGPSTAAGAATRDTADPPRTGPAPSSRPDRAEPDWGWSGSESTTTDGGAAGWGTHGWAYEEAPDDAPLRRAWRRSRAHHRRRRRGGRAAARPRGGRPPSGAREPARARAPARLAVAAGHRADRLAAGGLRRRHPARDRDRLRPVLRVLPRAAAAAVAGRPAARHRRPVRPAPGRRRRGVRDDRGVGGGGARRDGAVGEGPGSSGVGASCSGSPSRSRTWSRWSRGRSRSGAHDGG